MDLGMSTSTIGHDEERKPQYTAYLIERRILLGCTAAIGIASIVWIVAMTSDHWLIVSGGKGIWINQTGRYFFSANSGLWKTCRYASVPYIFLTHAARNFTQMSYSFHKNVLDLQEEFIKKGLFYNESQLQPLHWNSTTEITDEFRKRLFVNWLYNKTDEFHDMKMVYHVLGFDHTLPTDPPVFLNPLLINSTDPNVISCLVNETTYMNFYIPKQVRDVLFVGWSNTSNMIFFLNAYLRDLDIPSYSKDLNGRRILFEPPPLPPNRKLVQANGYNYIPYEKCRYHTIFSDGTRDPAMDDTLLDYSRTEASFSCLSLMLMLSGFFFSVYTFMNPRYMFKRLAGGIHFISAATGLVVIQVLMAAAEHMKQNLFYANFPKGSTYRFGYGYYIAWFVFSLNVVSCLIFFWYSKKKKGSKAPTEELAMADEPINIGR